MGKSKEQFMQIREMEKTNIKAEEEWKSDDDTSRADYINFCREYY